MELSSASRAGENVSLWRIVLKKADQARTGAKSLPSVKSRLNNINDL
jgi:hypothetical protein